MLNSNRGCHTFEYELSLVATKLVPQKIIGRAQTSFQLSLKIEIQNAQLESWLSHIRV